MASRPASNPKKPKSFLYHGTRITPSFLTETKMSRAIAKGVAKNRAAEANAKKA